jgi:tRNA threonylcarbamoyl adenosine modification protein (Sua5/YciO/YrdC/YwlC family)
MLIDIYPDNPDQRKINQIIQILNNGGLIVVPTDTIYAFAASINSKKGLERLAKIKNVKLKKSEFSLICDDLSDISNYTKPIERKVFRTMKNAFPGPFTFILNANNNIAKLFGTNKKEVGIRVPDHGFTRALINSLGHCLVSSSVHDDDEIIKYTTDPLTIFEKHENDVDAVINCGYGNNVASTIVDCTLDEPTILRQGAGIIS